MVRAILAAGALAVSLLVAPNLGAKGVTIELPIAPVGCGVFAGQQAGGSRWT